MVKSVTTLSSREFNRDIERAKQATRKGPVFITDRGRPVHVLLTIEEYKVLAGSSYPPQTLADLLAMPGAAEVEFEPARWREPLSKRFEL